MKILGISIFFIILVSIVVVMGQQPLVYNKIFNTPAPILQAPKPETIISITPSTILLTATNSAQAQIVINTGINTVNAVQLELAYDPRVLTMVQVEPGTFFKNPRILYYENNTKSGRITFALMDKSETSPVFGEGKLAFLSFNKQYEASQSAQTSIAILEKSVVTMSTVPFSVLKKGIGTTVYLR